MPSLPHLCRPSTLLSCVRVADMACLSQAATNRRPPGGNTLHIRHVGGFSCP